MQGPFFYIESAEMADRFIELDEETSRHVVQVLRMKVGEKLNLTDGKGTVWSALITEAHKKHCKVEIAASIFKERRSKNVTIAISLLKNPNRFEWFLEKATEIGVTEIIPLVCERTEKEKFRVERMRGIVISALLQSQQCWLPLLHTPQKFVQTISLSGYQTKLIAHCIPEFRYRATDYMSSQSTIILIGPEGDFTNEETELALQHGFIPVSLGENRLRSETAGVVAATVFCIG